MIKFTCGALFGCFLAAAVVAYGPKDTSSHIRATGQVIVNKVNETKFEICEREFLDETHCYQDRKMTSKDCDEQIHHRCG